MIIKRIDVLSAGKIMGIITAAIGLIAGILILLLSLLGGAMGAAADNSMLAFGAVGGIAAVIILPILYGVIGFISGVIQAFIYNIASGFVGGIKFETE